LTNHGSIKTAGNFIMAGIMFRKQVTHGVQISTLERELVCGITKETLPCLRIEIRKLIRSNSGKPIIEDHMERGSDGTRVRIQDKRDRTGMLGGQAHVNRTAGTRAPAWKLLTIRQGLVKNIDRTTPHMEIMELALFPPCLCEQVDWCHTSINAWNMIIQEDRLGNRHRPQGSVRQFGPMNRRMKQHRARNVHDRLNCAFCHSIVMMGANPCISDDLGKLAKHVREPS
jgi:hypothetical protein